MNSKTQRSAVNTSRCIGLAFVTLVISGCGEIGEKRQFNKEGLITTLTLGGGALIAILVPALVHNKLPPSAPSIQNWVPGKFRPFPFLVSFCATATLTGVPAFGYGGMAIEAAPMPFLLQMLLIFAHVGVGMAFGGVSLASFSGIISGTFPMVCTSNIYDIQGCFIIPFISLLGVGGGIALENENQKGQS